MLIWFDDLKGVGDCMEGSGGQYNVVIYFKLKIYSPSCPTARISLSLDVESDTRWDTIATISPSDTAFKNTKKSRISPHR